MGKRIVTSSSSSSSTCDHDINSDLFEEVLSLYKEDIENNNENDNNYNSFKEYIEQMIPPDVLDYIKGITGSDDTFLEAIYNERFLKSNDNNNNDSESNDNTNKYLTRHCEICERYVSLTEHHLIPKETHRNMLKKGLYTKDTLSITISICRLCHSTIYRFFTNDELSIHYNTVDKLLENEKFYKYARWASGLSDKRYTTVNK